MEGLHRATMTKRESYDTMAKPSMGLSPPVSVEEERKQRSGGFDSDDEESDSSLEAEMAVRITEREHMLTDKAGADDVVRETFGNMTMNDITDMFLDAEEGEVMESFRAQLDGDLITA